MATMIPPGRPVGSLWGSRQVYPGGWDSALSLARDIQGIIEARTRMFERVGAKGATETGTAATGRRRCRRGKGARARGLTLALTGAIVVTAMAACGGSDSAPGAAALRSVEPGTLKGEVYRALGPGPVDSTRFRGTVEYGYPLQQFLVAGEVAEVFWIPPEEYAPGDSIDWRASTPVLFRNIALMGWGWDEVEPLGEEMGVVFPGMSSWEPPAPRAPRDRDDPGEDEEG